MQYRTSLLKQVPALILCGLFAATTDAREACPAGAPQLIVYHAGSLSAAFASIEDLFTKQSGVCVTDTAGGSVSLARQVTAGRLPADLYAGADFEVIDQMLKPAGYADFSILFAGGAMVLAYTTDSKNAATIAKSGATFNPPDTVPEAASDWTTQLTQPGVTISGSHPFLDPGGYRADMIFQLAQDHYGVPNLYSELLAHYRIAGVPGGLGKAFDYQFTYEHSARASAKTDKTGTYRYVRLPDEVNLGAPGLNKLYARRGITIPGLQAKDAAATVTIPASRVTWGVTLMNAAPNRENALAFLQLLFSSQGAALLNAAGPTAINPPLTSKQDFTRLPASLKALVRAE
jgi:molybdate/tungstate transport system substrate-binding protein